MQISAKGLLKLRGAEIDGAVEIAMADNGQLDAEDVRVSGLLGVSGRVSQINLRGSVIGACALGGLRSVTIDCANATFRGSVDFTGCSGRTADFSGSVFRGNGLNTGESLRFSAMNFDRLEFRGCEMGWAADFSHIEARELFSLDGAHLRGPANLSGLKAAERISARGATFGDRARLNSATLGGRFDCSEARFLLFAPEFFQAKLSPDSSFSRVRLPPFHLDNSEAAYRWLKRECAELRDRDAEAVFFAQEQRAKRGRLPWFARLLSALYAGASNYGQSVGRPLVWLLAVIVLCGACYTELASRPVEVPLPGMETGGYDRCPSNWLLRDLPDGIFFAVQQVARPLSVWDSRYRLSGVGGCALMRNRVLARLLATAQSVVGLSIVALFLLSIRWRFRRE